MRTLLVAAAAALVVIGANAQVVNISTDYDLNPLTFQDPTYPGDLDTGETLHLAAGSYVFTPVDTTTAGALYTAANRFGTVQPDLSEGWEWDYFMSIGAGAGVQYGFGGGVAAGKYQPTAAAAFAAAPSPVYLTLATPTDVTLYWMDDIWSDNVGGVSIKVSAVPEPGSAVLLTVGLAVLASRRRSLSESSVNGDVDARV